MLFHRSLDRRTELAIRGGDSETRIPWRMGIQLILLAMLAAGVENQACGSDKSISSKKPDAVLRDDWLFQADNSPTRQRTRQEIQWTRLMAGRMAKLPHAPDLTAELKELSQLERRLTDRLLEGRVRRRALL